MKILFICSYSERPKTGGQLYHLKMVEAINEMNYDVVLASVNKFPYIFRLKIFSVLYIFLLFLIKRPNLIIQVSDTALRYIAFTLLTGFFKIPFIQIVHHINEKFHKFDLKSRINLVLIKYNLRNANRIVVNSRNTKLTVVKYIGHSFVDNIVIIHPGIETKFELREHRFWEDKKVWNLLSVGAIVERKGYEYLIEALNNLRQLPLRCYIVGDIEDKKYYAFLLNKVKAYHLEHKVEFTGFVSMERLSELYAICDIFLLVSLHEGYGIVLCEAICQGLPIIATNVGAIPEIIEDKKTGLLIEPKKLESIENAIMQLISKPSLAKELSHNAIRKCASMKTWDETKEQIKKVIKAEVDRLATVR